ncbi:hypothetical protein GCM10022225_21490 [Plantactinospora mayteni]|uniref:Uncharacterized protein n=1 Tax=Plantactinospora mayteni TaxID=566021 RepID=A0ABQ4ENW0_9ACTN|nr:hypothetical protein [Plantactinospora mayteni]GIG96330.1 hypothetical protein Pma05_29030 [Plantactinospora mayteni]
MSRETTVADDEATTGGPRQRYVVQLTVTSTDLPTAELLARTLTRSLRFLPDLVPGETTVALAGDPATRHPVFCARPLDGGGGGRCPLRTGHINDCQRIDPDDR